MAQHAYSFLDFNCAIVGPGGSFSLAQGAAVSKEGITFSPKEDRNNMIVGADGNGMHSLHADRSGSVVIRYLKTSPVNALLQEMFNFQSTSGSLHGQNTISGSQSASGDVITCEQVAFARQPDVVYSEDGQMLEWRFDAIKITIQLGSGV